MRDVFIGRGLTKLVDLVFPLRCPVCDGIVPIGEGKVCRTCRRKIRYVLEPRCQKCGRQLNDDAKLLCTACESTPHIFDRGVALYDYQSMKKSIYRFKYKKRCEYALFFAEEIYGRLNAEILNMEADAIIPIPLHRSRQKSRGYNQAELIAAHLSRLTGIPLEKNLVRRVRKTVPQKQLDARGRQNNLKKAFNIKPNVVKLNKTILIDDIYTTGSTIDAVAKELKRCGVGTVYFITLCIGEGF